MKNKKLKLASLLSLLITYNVSFSSEISELDGVIIENESPLDKNIVYTGQMSGLMCSTASKGRYAGCADSTEGFESELYQQGVIESFEPIFKTEGEYTQYLPVLFNDGRRAYLIVHENTDLQTIYGDESPIMKFSQYENMVNFKPEPLVTGSKITLERKELDQLSRLGKTEKNLNYIANNGNEYSEAMVSDFRLINEEYIKNAEVIDMLANLMFDIDRMKHKLYVYSKYNMPISPRVVFLDKTIYLVADFNYTADDWIFANGISISIDGELLNIDNLKFEREVHSGSISETTVVLFDEQKIEILKKIIKSKNSYVRFNGAKYYKDKEITKEYKKQILEILKVYYLSKK